jgi:hypothetical protein
MKKIKVMNGDVKAGELFLLSTGEYSDYTVNALVKVLIDFDAAKAIKNYQIESPIDEDRSYSDGLDKFIAYLLSHGYVEQIEYREFYLGAYDEFRDTEIREGWKA